MSSTQPRPALLGLLSLGLCSLTLACAWDQEPTKYEHARDSFGNGASGHPGAASSGQVSSEPCVSAADPLNAALKRDPLGVALSRLEASLSSLREAKVGETLRRLREVRGDLDAVKDLLSGSAHSFGKLGALEANEGGASGTSCLPELSLEQKLERARQYFENHPLLVATPDGPRLRADLLRVEDALAAFLASEIITTPAPDRCALDTPVGSYLWEAAPLDLALAELSQVPQALLGQLRASLREVGDSDPEGILALLPKATCEKLSQVVCHRLKQARQAQGGALDDAGLRARARSLTAAQAGLIALKDRVSALGCRPEEFGLNDSVVYARSLVADAQRQLDDDGERLAARLGAFLKRKEGNPKSETEESLDLLRLQRLEAASLVLGVAAPAISYLNAYSAPLDPTERAWEVAGEDLLNVAAGRKADGRQRSGLSELERFLGLLMLRRGESCEFVRSPFVRDQFGNTPGLLFARGRSLTELLAKQCAS